MANNSNSTGYQTEDRDEDAITQKARVCSINHGTQQADDHDEHGQQLPQGNACMTRLGSIVARRWSRLQRRVDRSYLVLIQSDLCTTFYLGRYFFRPLCCDINGHLLLMDSVQDLIQLLFLLGG